MIENDKILIYAAQALASDYVRIYFVDSASGEFRQYAPEGPGLPFQEIKRGDDFFSYLVNDAAGCVYTPDRRMFTDVMQRENIINLIKHSKGHTDIEYRLIVDGEPAYYTLRITACPGTESCFVLGIIKTDKIVEFRKKVSMIEKERETYNQIAEGLAEHFDYMFYLDIADGSYSKYRSENGTLAVVEFGDDFFEYAERTINTEIHPDDRKALFAVFTKQHIIESLRGKKKFTVEFRRLVGDDTVYYRHSGMWAKDRKHIIIYAENITSEVNVENALRESRRKNKTFSIILESLAARYDVIYYVNAVTDAYTGFTSNHIYGNIEIQEEGDHFFEDAVKNTDVIIHPDDRERVKNAFNKDYFISSLENNSQLVVNYRMLVNDHTQFTRFTAIWGSDGRHFIIGVENIDEEVKKESEHIKELNLANEMARRDELTGTKNKNAYQEYENSMQERINAGEKDLRFAIAVCDINNLKAINDELGHKSGDEYIRAACRLICEVFAHSPVFRIGGDEFVVVVGSRDYDNRNRLLEHLRRRVQENMRKKDGPVVACGMADYDPVNDRIMSEIFERADSIMYDNKTRLKEKEIREENDDRSSFPEDRRRKLDVLFEAFSLVSEGTYVFLCDMKYDISRWSQAAIDTFGLPGGYMSAAGDIWEQCIHPEDRAAYHAGIGAIFSGDAFGHDMQYRAQRLDGTYDVCTCRGVVLKDESGSPDYFGGVIRNHGMIGRIDMLTGLGNQYEWFDAIHNALMNNTKLKICMVGTSKFSEINEVYGYSFGNRVLQKLGRDLVDSVGIRGNAYRLDGTKFAVVTPTMENDEIKRAYNAFRTMCRSYTIDGTNVMLELNAGLISINDFSIDEKTIYACLNFVYGLSKTSKQGELVEFLNELNDGSRQRIEKLHAIRSSITHGCSGFYLLYQPVVDANTEELIGAEALLRWKNDEYGVVPPDHFVPILENDPLFCELGQWILRTAVMSAKKLLEQYPGFVINVNLSYIQLERPDFVDTVIKIIEQAGYPASRLCLEITERCRLLDMGLLKNVLVNLRGKGIRVALDDFGTGFSSIGAAMNLPFDTIKIDRSFVMRIEENEKDRELIGNFADLARTFGSKICVEGIETEGMCEILRKYNVQSFQGYYYGKPIELSELLEWKMKK
ncbi:MAG: EAL domain-containing protein [Ruminiclostridium sp.]|nr:EAL domain-containing protein [Ruminiclostridium sp.]